MLLLPVGIHFLVDIILFMCISIALLMFDTVLTLPMEVKNIWHEKHQLGSILYVLAQYPTLASSLIFLYVNLFVISIQVCEYTASYMTPVLTSLHM